MWYKINIEVLFVHTLVLHRVVEEKMFLIRLNMLLQYLSIVRTHWFNALIVSLALPVHSILYVLQVISWLFFDL